MLVEILKVVLPFLGGGLAGVVLNEWLRRRSSRLQAIPLIERVNRLISPELKGFTLARVAGGEQNPRLEEIRNVREYQLTLRNTSMVHLRDVEIQFEFPTEDVEGWASRPALSKTAPVDVGATVTEPWKKGFRWRIPNLPSTDSIEFSFKAVNPQSDDYEVALYGTDRIVIERSKGEPKTKNKFGWMQAVSMVIAAAMSILGLLSALLISDSARSVTNVNQAGCMLTIVSMFSRYERTTWPWSDSGPWEVFHKMTNTGAQKCIVQSDRFKAEAVTLSPGEVTFSKSSYTVSKPKLATREFAFGVDSPTQKGQAKFYEGPLQH